MAVTAAGKCPKPGPWSGLGFSRCPLESSARLCRFAILDRNAFLLQQGLELAGLEHFPNNIAPPDELALHIELGDRWPLRVGLDALSQVVGFKHIDALVGRPDVIEDLDDLAR